MNEAEMARGRSFLVVARNEFAQRILVDALAGLAPRRVSIVSSDQVVTALGQHAYDLIVLDADLPDDRGFEICTGLRARGDRTPVIFLGTRNDAEELRAAFQCGGDDYVARPLDTTTFRLRVVSLLRRSHKP